mmetsp:Transcript_918/g.2603  ORF Transcript_918/g.2603 Transcript_918/m.2603 type:complete len:201 (-) Transcript_918:591-1193(-)|eukprot:CAMPEP_0198110038 /NCGR_PEP_ID=MMETSP1442-20131203/2064_1 /TAXON_ID= /ORGANISM="Craspedostauros australis, Strain CCMP3328" /LENGTH=200 /DNA_ID=CAMNT_0043765939 /DNA_START=74 /DNA_END=676 /DNA_ORIENTATION=+
MQTIAQVSLLLLVAVICSSVRSTSAFVATSTSGGVSTQLAAESSNANRRAFLGAMGGIASAVATTNAPAFAEQAKEYRQGIEVNAFNGLIFNYRGGSFNGLDEDDLAEPSVTYSEFNRRLKAGEVAFVEFMAPDGDAAYVTFKASEADATPKPIRIGEGYPIEQHDGYSSPMFCVKTVAKAGVPYKFTVPGMAKFQAMAK